MKHSRGIFSRLLLGSFSLACASAWAQGPGGGGPPRMVLQALDTDHDGSLSPAEIKSAAQSLSALDRNGDGQLTQDELQPRPDNAGATPDELVTRLMSFDKNGDGALTRDELPARMQNVFERGDSNHDGKLTPDEIRSMASHQGMPAGPAAGQGGGGMTRMDPLLNALDSDHDGTISAGEITAASETLLKLDRNGDGQITPDEMRPRQQSPEERVAHMLDEWDTNKDGKISKAEAPDRMQQQFESIDKNGDGFLDKEELMQFFSTMGPGPRGGGGRPGGPGGPGEAGVQKEQHQ